MILIPNQPRAEDIQAAVELGVCPYCGEESVKAPRNYRAGMRSRCRSCCARWVVTDDGIRVIRDNNHTEFGQKFIPHVVSGGRQLAL